MEWVGVWARREAVRIINFQRRCSTALIEWQCIERKDRFLRPAEKGLVIYNCTKDMRISQLDMAAGWERMLKDVGNGKQSAVSFLKEIEIFTQQVTEEILSLNPAKP